MPSTMLAIASRVPGDGTWAAPRSWNSSSPPTRSPAVTGASIIAAVFCLIPIINFLSLVLGAVGLVLGVIAWRGASKGTRAGKGKAITGVVLAVVSGFVAILANVAFATAVNEVGKSVDRAVGNATEQVLAEDLDVKIGRYKLTDQGFGLRDGALTVTLTNKDDKRQSFDVKLEAVSAGGQRISTDTAYVSDLAPGQADEVEMFEFATDTDMTQLKGATFKVIEASAY